MEFPTEKGIGREQSNQQASRRSYHAIIRNKAMDISPSSKHQDTYRLGFKKRDNRQESETLLTKKRYLQSSSM